MVNPNTRQRVLREHGGECLYCGAKAKTVDHLTPVARGGRNVRANLVAACLGCNLRKGSRTLREFMLSRPIADWPAILRRWMRALREMRSTKDRAEAKRERARERQAPEAKRRRRQRRREGAANEAAARERQVILASGDEKKIAALIRQLKAEERRKAPPLR